MKLHADLWELQALNQPTYKFVKIKKPTTYMIKQFNWKKNTVANMCSWL